MLAKALLLTIIAACGVTSGAAVNHPAVTDPPDRAPPPDTVEEGQHFCCADVDQDKYTGEGCVTIEPGQMNQCNNVLYCDGKWTKKDGIVKCE